jgi:formamidopyrimidine-DNA glycosylase
MPELPDVQIFKQYFDATSLQRKIAAVIQCDADLLAGVSKTELQHRLSGKSFSATSRHGKYLFARFGEKDFLVLHFGMTGFLRAYKHEDKAPGHIGLLLRFTDGYHLAYDCRRRLGHISFTDNPVHFIKGRKLGPDALALCADPAGFAKRLQGHSGSIKALLMNQKVLAGIGNIYADEILFRAGLHPKKKTSDLDEEERRTLAVKTRHVLETAIDRRAGAKGWPSSWLLPRRQPGKSCPRCSGEIQRITVSGRSTYFCAGHQS